MRDDVVTVNLTADGLLPGFEVIGFHGEFESSDSTPSVQGPVVIHSATRRMVHVPDYFPDGVFEGLLGAPVPVAGQIPGAGTLIMDLPWKARARHGVVVLGPRELETLPAGKLDGFRAALALDGKPLLALYRPEEDAWKLVDEIGDIAREKVLAAVKAKSADLADLAWWLLRAGNKRSDAALACAAMRRAGVVESDIEAIEELISFDEDEKRQLVDDARAELETLR